MQVGFANQKHVLGLEVRFFFFPKSNELLDKENKLQARDHH